MIYRKNKISEICYEDGCSLNQAYFLPTKIDPYGLINFYFYFGLPPTVTVNDLQWGITPLTIGGGISAPTSDGGSTSTTGVSAEIEYGDCKLKIVIGQSSYNAPPLQIPIIMDPSPGSTSGFGLGVTASW